jgi:hypothetical protein
MKLPLMASIMLLFSSNLIFSQTQEVWLVDVNGKSELEKKEIRKKRATQIIQKSKDRIEFKSEIPLYIISKEEINDKSFYKFKVPYGIYSFVEGSPMLPEIHSDVKIPYGANFSINIDRVDWIELSNTYNIIPAEPPLPDSDETFSNIKDQKVYSKDEFLPNLPIWLNSEMKIRGNRYLDIIYSPVSYNPAKGKVKVAKTVLWHIIIQDNDANNVK